MSFNEISFFPRLIHLIFIPNVSSIILIGITYRVFSKKIFKIFDSNIRYFLSLKRKKKYISNKFIFKDSRIEKLRIDDNRKRKRKIIHPRIFFSFCRWSIYSSSDLESQASRSSIFPSALAFANKWIHCPSGRWYDGIRAFSGRQKW